MAAMIETANPAFYSAAIQLPSAPSSIPLDSVPRTWTESSAAPFILKAGAESAIPEEASTFAKVRGALEIMTSVVWVIACAAVSIVWVACFRIQPKNRGVK